MSRYKGRQNTKAVERDFPHIVEFPIPERGSRGIYFGAASTRAKAIEAEKKTLETGDFKTMRRKKRPQKS